MPDKTGRVGLAFSELQVGDIVRLSTAFSYYRLVVTDTQPLLAGLIDYTTEPSVLSQGQLVSLLGSRPNQEPETQLSPSIVEGDRLCLLIDAGSQMAWSLSAIKHLTVNVSEIF